MSPALPGRGLCRGSAPYATRRRHHAFVRGLIVLILATAMLCVAAPWNVLAIAATLLVGT